MKKVLFYIPSLSPAGGIERVLSTIANKLSDNYDVTILTKDGCDPFYTLSKSVKLRSLNIPLVLDMNSKFKRIISYGINTIASIRKLRSFFCSDEVYCSIMSINILENFLPENTLPFLKIWFGEYHCHLKITKNRNSKF